MMQIPAQTDRKNKSEFDISRMSNDISNLYAEGPPQAPYLDWF